MKRIAISGNIASGKSEVQKILTDMGYKVLDTDEVSRKLLTVNNKELFDAFKSRDVFENGEFSRYKVGQLIFSDEEARLKIASVMHPQIAKEIEKFYNENETEDMLFVGIPLLFEAKMEYLFDKIIFIFADDLIRFERLLKRNHYSEEHAKARLKCQMPQEEKIELSDYVINNNGSLPELKSSVIKLIEQIR